MEFHCVKCGLCCRNIGGIEPLAVFDAGGGVCIHLRKDNLCDIYDRRPLVCNIDAMYREFFAPLVSWEEYVTANTAVCDWLIEKNQLIFVNPAR